MDQPHVTLMVYFQLCFSPSHTIISELNTSDTTPEFCLDPFVFIPIRFPPCSLFASLDFHKLPPMISVYRALPLSNIYSLPACPRGEESGEAKVRSYILCRSRVGHY